MKIQDLVSQLIKRKRREGGATKMLTVIKKRLNERFGNSTYKIDFLLMDSDSRTRLRIHSTYFDLILDKNELKILKSKDGYSIITEIYIYIFIYTDNEEKEKDYYKIKVLSSKMHASQKAVTRRMNTSYLLFPSLFLIFSLGGVYASLVNFSIVPAVAFSISSLLLIITVIRGLICKSNIVLFLAAFPMTVMFFYLH
jgi:hypothetical protein